MTSHRRAFGESMLLLGRDQAQAEKKKLKSRDARRLFSQAATAQSLQQSDVPATRQGTGTSKPSAGRPTSILHGCSLPRQKHTRAVKLCYRPDRVCLPRRNTRRNSQRGSNHGRAIHLPCQGATMETSES